MITGAKVSLYGKTVGFLQWNQRSNVASFEYDTAFSTSGLEPAPLMMPVGNGITYSFPNLNRTTYEGLPGMIADSLPDRFGKALLQQHLALMGRTQSNPVESLCYLGKRCMGALEFEPEISDEGQVKNNFELKDIVKVAAEAMQQKEQFITNISDNRKKAVSDILMLSSSAGGQRAKAVIAYNRSTGEIRSGQTEAPEGFLHYLIKLDGVNSGSGLTETNNYGRIEYSFYRLATECGIEMAESELIQENGRAHFLTRRFDRNGAAAKTHMQTLCGIAHYDFNLPEAYSYEQALNVMNGLHLTSKEKEQMFRRVVFNVSIRNQDDHSKNISFLMDSGGKWSLSPAYDMGYNYNPEGRWTSRHQMSINGKTDGITHSDLMVLADKYGIAGAGQIIQDIQYNTKHWPAIAEECGIPAETARQMAANFVIL